MELLDSKLVYEGYGVEVEIRRYRRTDGTEVKRQVIDHPGSVAIRAQPREAIEIVRLPLAELDATLPRIRDASTLIALMALAR